MGDIIESPLCVEKLPLLGMGNAVVILRALPGIPGASFQRAEQIAESEERLLACIVHQASPCI